LQAAASWLDDARHTADFDDQVDTALLLVGVV